MLFNSIEFVLFLPISFLLYWFVVNRSLKIQNFFLLSISYLFYGWWDYRFLSLIAFSSTIDYLVGKRLATSKKPQHRKLLLLTSICVNLGFLGFFKYYNFFLESFVDTFTFFGHAMSADRLNIILPVGISFYTFQTLSYSIDVYKRKLEPANDIIAFFAFVSFFPQLVAGPIERATNLLPQFYKKRSFELSSAIDGMRQILWGLLKKIVIADNCALYANEIFENYETYSSGSLMLGAVFFSLQIYCDFSGYSDIAIGTSRLFGFSLMKNFAFPYFSRNVSEFWRRWHISLSTWFRDYLYIPLGGSQVTSKSLLIRNIFAIFIVSGFWHGANWTFIIWGALNAFYILPTILSKKQRTAQTTIVGENKLLPSLKESLQLFTTYILTCIAWIFFRAESVSVALEYIVNIINQKNSHSINISGYIASIIALFLIVEWLQRTKEHALDISFISSRALRWTCYFLILNIIYIFSAPQQSFIYFQF